jgi:HTH-type transcriptional regulator, sugar sensing transcriptional regulator
MDFTSLKEAGLTDGEVKVYLALLELGSCTTGPIIEKSGVARSIIYQILEKLIQKGLVSYIVKEKTRHFQAAEPNKLLDYIDNREKILQENRNKVENLMPQLLLLKKSAKESEVQVFEGFKGIQTVHEHTYLKLNKGEGYFYLGIPPFQEEMYHLYWQRDHKRREKAGIKCKILFDQGTDKEILINRNKHKLCDARYLPLNIQTPAWFMGYKDVIVIGLQSNRGIAIEITNEEIAHSFKVYFEEFWKQSRPFI